MAPSQTFLFFCSFFLLPTLVAGSTDPCNDHQSIKNPYRSAKYKVSPGEVYLCDNKLSQGWYRFTSIVGGKMPTTKPQPYHCGTIAPIWMRGTHPTSKGQVIQATACTNFNNKLDGCAWPKQMSVKNCGDFFVYNLGPSRACSMAYCAGDLMPCPKGQTGIVPNCTTTTEQPTTSTTTASPTTVATTDQVHINETSTKETEEPTTSEATDIEPTANITERVVIECEIRLLFDWVVEYSNVRSKLFEAIASRLWKEIWSSFVLAKDDNLEKVVVSKLRKGSVIAEFELIFKNEPEDPLKPIRERIKDGKLGELDVDAESLRLRDGSIKHKTEPKEGDSSVLIIVLVVIAIIIIIIIVVAVLIYKRKQKRTRHLQRIRKKDQDGEPGETIPLHEKNSSK